MASKKQKDAGAIAGGDKAPAWADGLKQLYDDVVDEPLPDAFMDLLAKLDDSANDVDASGDGSGS